ncbi:MAG: tRNA uridine-5-carboxymethylaminomethyl(34) synthesis GTPase MnmE [Synergistaceae bacterium]|jgi:tRNA modification GTPase|nr:tRNA uridine-5-carboxymethylaminomethyl(34) synthesis GTPase MnmE [Synergistaceae bacterium]
MDSDVIAAVATAWGESAIAVVRISGGGSLALADKFFRGRRPLASAPARRMELGLMTDGDSTVDEVLAVRFERGFSYTGEESVEIQCHGGAAAARRCMDILTASGARAALPGEFTKRAYLNGRIDLSQAEAVLGIIRARSAEELASSERTLQGELSDALFHLSCGLTKLRASIEARIDFPEDVDDAEAYEFVRETNAVRSEAGSLLERCRAGLALKNGIRAAIIGRPNVGKSSLMNAMLASDRAIVTDIPGTTRDTLDAPLIHRGLVITLVDTAGLRTIPDEGASGVIESLGAARSRAAIAGSDLCVLVTDSSEGVIAEDAAAAEESEGKRTILALNKCDLERSRPCAELTGDFAARVEVSALTGQGIPELKDALFELSVGSSSASSGLMSAERIIGALESARRCVSEAGDALGNPGGMDVAGSLLSEAAEHISAQLGIDASEELLDEIFSSYCVGK